MSTGLSVGEGLREKFRVSLLHENEESSREQTTHHRKIETAGGG